MFFFFIFDFFLIFFSFFFFFFSSRRRHTRCLSDWSSDVCSSDLANSFPSGHAADTFAFATALERHLGWRGAVPAYIFSSYVAMSRLPANRSEEHTSELQSLRHLVCRLLLEKKKQKQRHQ